MAEPKAIQGLKDLLQKENNRDLVATGRGQEDAGSLDAKQVLDALRAGLAHDENVTNLSKAIDTATGKLIKLLKPAAPPAAPATAANPSGSAPSSLPQVSVAPSSSSFAATVPSTADAPSSTSAEHHAVKALVDVDVLAAHLRQLVADGAELEVVVTARGKR